MTEYDWKKASRTLAEALSPDAEEQESMLFLLDAEEGSEVPDDLEIQMEMPEDKTLTISGGEESAKQVRTWAWENRKESWIRGSGLCLWAIRGKDGWKVGAARALALVPVDGEG